MITNEIAAPSARNDIKNTEVCLNHKDGQLRVVLFPLNYDSFNLMVHQNAFLVKPLSSILWFNLLSLTYTSYFFRGYLEIPIVHSYWNSRLQLAGMVLSSLGILSCHPYISKLHRCFVSFFLFPRFLWYVLLMLPYAYYMGMCSSWQIKRTCKMDAAFLVITANQNPDYSMVYRFRWQNKEEQWMLFTHSLRLCAEVGLVKVGVVALDGINVKADASLSANQTEEYIEV